MVITAPGMALVPAGLFLPETWGNTHRVEQTGPGWAVLPPALEACTDATLPGPQPGQLLSGSTVHCVGLLFTDMGTGVMGS